VRTFPATLINKFFSLRVKLLMSEASRSSRLFVGILVLAALVAIGVVASSGRSSSRPVDDLALLADGNANPPLVSSESGLTQPSMAAGSRDPSSITAQDASVPGQGVTVASDAALEPNRHDPNIPTSPSEKSHRENTDDSQPNLVLAAKDRHAEASVRRTEELTEASDTPSAESATEPATRGRPDVLQRLSRRYVSRKVPIPDDPQPAVPIVQDDAKTLRNPQVGMSQEHRETCKVFVGDTMPSFELNNRDGESKSLDDLLGKKLTVVVFWASDNRFAVDQFNRLEHELGGFHEAGVNVVSVHVGATSDTFQKTCQQQPAQVACLLDADEAVFEAIATRKLPRTYLLDADKKILWMDIEYSRTTRHDLRDALRFQLERLK
jgi:peroxiredoxin